VGDILAGIVQIIVAASVNAFVDALIRRAQEGLFAPATLAEQRVWSRRRGSFELVREFRSRSATSLLSNRDLDATEMAVWNESVEHMPSSRVYETPRGCVHSAMSDTDTASSGWPNYYLRQRSFSAPGNLESQPFSRFISPRTTFQIVNLTSSSFSIERKFFCCRIQTVNFGLLFFLKTKR
jgi:hypothetical protein